VGTRIALVLLLVLWTGLSSASAQADVQDDIRKGHQLAATICAICHVAAPDQAYAPIMKPPAPSFDSIAQRKDTTVDSLRLFMTTTHRGLDAPKGMPDPELMDYQIREITAYILSLRK
jgi:mono/diheme cytochrome c family protein